MFDRLIESGGLSRRRRTGGYFLGASVLYFFALVVSASLTIMWFSPGLVEALDVNVQLVPPPFTGPARPITQARPGSIESARVGVVSQKRVAASENVRTDLPVLNNGASRPIHEYGGPGTLSTGGWVAVAGASEGVGAAPPPPIRDPAPTPPPRIAESRPLVSEGVLRGRATTTFTPQYPEGARRAGIFGAVQIQVLIAEDGRVVEATVLKGHPFLRDAALSAAKRWAFSPTRLSGVPVKVQGILTFNFTLN